MSSIARLVSRRQNARGLAVLGSMLAVASIGCGVPEYSVKAISPESIHGQISAEWFQRELYNEDHQVESIELIYCPVLNKQPIGCKTSVVWEKDSLLATETESGGSGKPTKRASKKKKPAQQEEE